MPSTPYAGQTELKEKSQGKNYPCGCFSKKFSYKSVAAYAEKFLRSLYFSIYDFLPYCYPLAGGIAARQFRGWRVFFTSFLRVTL